MFYIIINFVEIHQTTYIYIRFGSKKTIRLDNVKNYYYYYENPKDVHFLFTVLSELNKDAAEVIKKYAAGDLEPNSEIRETFFEFIEQDERVGDGSCRLYEVNFTDGAVNVNLIKNMYYTDNIEYNQLVCEKWEDK